MNFRDLGGIATKDHVTIAPGRLFRSGNFGRVATLDGRALVKAFELHTYIDLRTPAEVAREGEPLALIEAGVIWQPLPMEPMDPVFGQISHPAPSDWAAFYLRLFERHRALFAQLLINLARAERPVVFGCSVGKDRTGIATAALLSCLGVDENSILADYMETTALIARHVDNFEDYWLLLRKTRKEFIEHYLTARGEILTEFLAMADEKWGGLVPALEMAGVGPSVLDRLRTKYLTRAA